MWENTLFAIFRIECCATFAKTALRNSLKPAAPALAIPSKKKTFFLSSSSDTSVFYLHPNSKATETVVSVSGADSILSVPPAFK